MKKIMLFLLLALPAAAAFAQIEDPVKWSYGAKRISATEAVVLIKATIEDGWHIYSQKEVSGPVKTTITFAPSKVYTLVGKTLEPKSITKYEKTFKTNVSYFENEVVFQQRVKIKPGAPATIKGKFEYMTCDDSKCLPPAELEFTVAIPAKTAGK